MLLIITSKQNEFVFPQRGFGENVYNFPAVQVLNNGSKEHN